MPDMPLGQFRVYVKGQNMFTFTKYSGLDPEIGYDSGIYGEGNRWANSIDLGLYPLAKTYLVGVQVSF
jgi:hypothetical protein